MEKKTSRPRTEFLAIAVIFIIIALLLVVLIVGSGFRKNGGEVSAAASEDVSGGESGTESEASGQAESAEESVPTDWLTVRNSEVGKGLVALTSLPEDGSDPAEPAGLVNVYGSKNDTYSLSGSGLTLCSKAMNAVNRFLQAFHDAKGDTNIVLSRAYSKRAELGTQDEKREADLTTGNAISFVIYPSDPDGDTLGTGKFVWLRDNCTSHGFILRYPDEKLQYTGEAGDSRLYRFVGYTHAAYMGKFHYCLEEYLNVLRENTSYDAPARFEAGGENADRECLLYYVKASDGEETQIPVPEGTTDYEISGNGTDGFVVIVYV